MLLLAQESQVIRPFSQYLLDLVKYLCVDLDAEWRRDWVRMGNDIRKLNIPVTLALSVIMAVAGSLITVAFSAGSKSEHMDVVSQQVTLMSTQLQELNANDRVRMSQISEIQRQVERLEAKQDEILVKVKHAE